MAKDYGIPKRWAFEFFEFWVVARWMLFILVHVKKVPGCYLD